MTIENRTSLYLGAILLIAIGFLALLGWIFQIGFLVKLSPDYAAMTIGAAVCFMLSGFSILSLINLNHLISKKIAFGCTGLIALISSAYLFEHIFNINLGIDFASFQQKMGSTGRPAINALVAFLLSSIAAFTLILNSSQKQIYLVSRLPYLFSILVSLIGVLGLLGYFLNLREMYSWGGIQSMALNTALGTIVLGISLLKLCTETPIEVSETNYQRKIITIAVVVMLTIGLGVALLSFHLMERRLVSTLKNDLSARAQDQSEFINQILAHRIQRAKVLAQSAEVISVATLFNKHPEDQNVTNQLNAISARFVENGFDKIGFYNPAKNQLINKSLSADDAFFVAINDRASERLLWEDGYFLLSHNPVYSNGQLVANLITKQSLPPLNDILPNTIKIGQTNDVVICGDAVNKLKCFPNRSSKKPFLVEKQLNGQVLMSTQAAVNRNTGIAETVDYRGIKVIAAFAPVGTTSLGLVQKVAQSEIYSPVKLLMYKVLLVTLLLLLFGYLLIRKQLTPLVNIIVEQRKQADIEKARFIAAAEGGFDNFYIFEAVRDPSNNIVDLRCIYINKAGSELINKKQGEMIGKLLLQEVPVNREKRLFDKYKYVIETGNSLAEEFAIDDNDVNASWIYWQIVKLGDGVAVTSRDISDRKRLEFEIAKAARLHSAIIESASYSIIATDVNGIIVSMNKAAERMLWYREDELAGKFTPEIIHVKEEVELSAAKLSSELGRTIEPGFEVFAASAIDDIPSEAEWTYVRKDGSKFPVKLSLTVLKEADGSIYGYLGIAYDISEQKRAQEYITHIALHDVLTGLPNRALFDDRAKVAIENAKRSNQSLAVALLDLDHFKYINDSLGHHIGDKLLQTVSNRLLNSIRPTDTVARMGGDEFAFLFANISHPEGSKIVLQRILDAFVPKVDVVGHILHTTPSIGIAIFPTDGLDIETLLQNADTAMYRAKALGRNGYQIFNSEMRHLASQKIMHEQELREAIEKQHFELFYQPQINLDTSLITGVEALIRWQKSPGTFVSPADFIPLAEETGLILPIGEWVIRTAIKQAKEFELTFGRPISMAVNVSPRQFRQVGLVNYILNTLKEFNVSPEMLEVEITENLMMENIESTVEVMRGLTKGGVKIALDDFGTGYSSLSYLSKFKFDRIKIDQSFIKNCLTNAEDAAIVKTIISMSKTLGVKIIAEGVETQQQLDFIRLHQCEEAQGYLIGKPVPSNQINDSAVEYLAS